MSWLSNEIQEVLLNSRTAKQQLTDLTKNVADLATKVDGIDKKLDQILQILSDPATGFKVSEK